MHKQHISSVCKAKTSLPQRKVHNRPVALRPSKLRAVAVDQFAWLQSPALFRSATVSFGVLLNSVNTLKGQSSKLESKLDKDIKDLDNKLDPK